MNVNALMSDSTDMDEKFAMMDQTIEALKKSVDEKYLHIAQLMNKLETFTLGEVMFPLEKIMMLVSEGKIIIDMDETLEANHASVAPNQTKCSRSQIMPNTISLQFKSFTPIEVDFPKKTFEGSLEINDNEVDGWTLVTHKKPRH
ncbi:hypothetical protein R3W88_008178 [Solanum pinnatisectum]|uniref:SHSP domain-containing protein n=1 Tax=Solanum pinnatisectum TaxID=50273 RepID=A0AAV9MB09_9SOLN|nr:hypothetical protein R3W88_008178 [Solanum pinnatisectum]